MLIYNSKGSKRLGTISSSECNTIEDFFSVYKNNTNLGTPAVRPRQSKCSRYTALLNVACWCRGSSPQVVGTSTLEKKNKDLNRATRELEAKMRNLQQRTETDKVRINARLLH